MGISVFAEGLPSTAYLCGSIGATSVWEAGDATSGSTVANVDGDAQYQVEWIVTDGGTSTMEFLVIQIPGLTVHQYENMKINIDSVYVDGKSLIILPAQMRLIWRFMRNPRALQGCI